MKWILLFLVLFLVACEEIELQGDTEITPSEEQIDDQSEITLCPDELRQAEVCSGLYEPVCGQFSKKVQCLKAPCTQTFSNVCMACSNKEIIGYTSGPCEEI